MNIQEILERDDIFLYQLLDRMRCDCEYFLGFGNRNPKHLWAGDVKSQIEYMKAIWNDFPQDGKPEWLTLEQIVEIEKNMLETPSQSTLQEA